MVRRMSTEKRNGILRLLVEGNSIRSVCRLMGTNIPSVLRQLNWAGEHCRALMDERMRGLTLRHVEVDEIWTFVRKKQSRLTVDEKQERHDIGDIYLWTSFDQDTKLMPSYIVGKRSADNARKLMMDLRARLVTPKPHDSDDHHWEEGKYRQVTQISTDGLAAYPEAVDLAFGPYVKFGTIVKEYRNATMQYTPSEMVGTNRNVRKGGISPWSICTSHVERNNLTIRTFMKRFTRLALGFSKKLENLEDAIALHLAYYNFCWRSRYPDDSGKRGQYRPPAAMAAGVVDRFWSFDDLMAGGVA